jgi:hypothetical protein
MSKLTSSSSSNYVDTRDIELSKISVPERLRILQPEKVEVIVESIQDIGLINPISVREKDDGYELVAGNHRLEAVRKLGFTSILATIQDVEGDKAKLAEIDENLIRAELTPAELADHFHKRKEIYERLHPDSKHGGDRKSISQLGISRGVAFIDDAAEKTGKSRSDIARHVKRGKDIPNVGQTAHTSLDKGTELDAVAELPPDKQQELISRAKKGEKVSAKSALKSKGKSKAAKVLPSKLARDFKYYFNNLDGTVDALAKADSNGLAWALAYKEVSKPKVRAFIEKMQKALDSNSGETKTSAVKSEAEAKPTHGTN